MWGGGFTDPWSSQQLVLARETVRSSYNTRELITSGCVYVHVCVCVIVCYCHCAVYQANKSPVMLYAKQLREQRGRERWKKTGSQLLIIARNTIPQKPPARRRLMSPYPVPLSMCCCSFPRVALCVCVCVGCALQLRFQLDAHFKHANCLQLAVSPPVCLSDCSVTPSSVGPSSVCSH